MLNAGKKAKELLNYLEKLKTNKMKQEEAFKTSDSMLSLNTTPFSVKFSWQGQRITVQLEKGEDVLKLAKIFSDFLTSNYIPNKIINK